MFSNHRKSLGCLKNGGSVFVCRQGLDMRINHQPCKYKDTVVEHQESCSHPRYDGLFVQNLSGIPGHCILMLPGTSTDLSDMKTMISSLVDRGYSVASLERPTGILFDRIKDPSIYRSNTVKHWIGRLQNRFNIQSMDVIAHSYASFDIMRLINSNQIKYKKLINNIILINPAGFIKSIKYFNHCLRFLFIYVLEGYINIFKWLYINRDDNDYNKSYFDLKLNLLTSFFIKTIQNPIKTFREVRDIVSINLENIMIDTIHKYNFRIVVALNTEDDLLPHNRTLSSINNLFDQENVLLFPGNHSDLFLPSRELEIFLDNIERITKDK